MSPVSRGIDRIAVTFDEPTLVADAGLIVPATLMVRLGLEALVNQMVHLGGRVGGSRPGRKVLTLVAAILAGATHIDHADRLRAGATQRVLPFRVMAPSTLGTFLRAFTFGHVRQLDAVIAEAIRRAWSARGGSGHSAGDDRPRLDHLRGPRRSQGRGRLWLHPRPRLSPAPRHAGRRPARCSTPGCARGPPSAAPSASSKSSSPGCAGPGPPVRSACAGRLGVLLLCAHRHLGAPRGGLLDHGDDQRPGESLHRGDRRVGLAPHHLSRRRRGPGGRDDVRDRVAGRRRELRLVVRRTRLTDPRQLALWPDWRHHAFVTNVELDTVAADAFHRDHATVELAIRDLKEGAGLEHCPSGHFFANAAWLACAVLAHNLVRWTARLGDIHPDDQLTVARSVRTRVLALPGRLVNRSGTSSCVSPSDGPGPHLLQGPRSDPGPAARHLNERHRGPAQPQTLIMR